MVKVGDKVSFTAYRNTPSNIHPIPYRAYGEVTRIYNDGTRAWIIGKDFGTGVNIDKLTKE